MTNKRPKCLIEIGNKSMLSHWLERLEGSDVTEVLINLHHHADQIQEAIGRYRGSIRVYISYEPVLLGSAGTLAEGASFAKDGPFWVVYCDNFTDVDLRKVRSFHEGYSAWATLVLFRSKRPEACGIVELDNENWIVDFEEKPHAPRSNLAWGGIMLCEPRIFSLLSSVRPLDIGSDLLPRLVGRSRGYICPGYLVDMGTPEGYAAAQKLHM